MDFVWGPIWVGIRIITIIVINAGPLEVLGPLRSRMLNALDMEMEGVPTTPACTWWNAQRKILHLANWSQLIHPGPASSMTKLFFGVESIMRVNAASLDIRDATTSTPGTLNDLTTDLIMANNNMERGCSVRDLKDGMEEYEIIKGYRVRSEKKYIKRNNEISESIVEQ